MIRRGFWLVVGAAGGIMGYRRACALTRQAAETLGARPKKPSAARRRWARQTIRFTRDVREGMDLYMSRHYQGQRSTLDAESRRPPGPSLAEVPAGASGGRPTRPVQNRDSRQGRASFGRADNKKNAEDNH